MNMGGNGNFSGPSGVSFGFQMTPQQYAFYGAPRGAPPPPPQEIPIESPNIELQIFIEDTNQLFKVYYNRSYYPTLPEYF